MTTWQGNIGGNTSDDGGRVLNTTIMQEGTTVASLSPELQGENMVN